MSNREWNDEQAIGDRWAAERIEERKTSEAFERGVAEGRRQERAEALEVIADIHYELCKYYAYGEVPPGSNEGKRLARAQAYVAGDHLPKPGEAKP